MDILLDNSMFDDGSFECYNFWFATAEGVYQVDSEFVKGLDFVEQIVERMKQGHGHLVTTDLVYCGEQILEIQWG